VCNVCIATRGTYGLKPKAARVGGSVQKQTTDEHFLHSATAVSCFFEQKAFDERGTLVKDKALAINKIGHAMHDLDPVFTPFSRSAALGHVLRAVGLQAPTPVQSMYIFKQPFIGGAYVGVIANG
jgi:phytanoyl-CoA hydroxylase